MKKKAIKLYIHHDLFHEIATGKNRSWIVRILIFPFVVLYELCFSVGSALLYLIRNIAEGVRHLVTAVVAVKAKKILFKTLEFKLSLIIFCSLIFGGVLISQAGNAISSGLALQSRVLGNATAGVAQLQDAQKSLSNQETGVAQVQFAQALNQFQKAQTDLDTSGGTLQALLDLVPQKQDAEAIVSAVSDMTQAGIALTKTYELINSVNFSAQGLKVGVDNKESLQIFSTQLKSVSELSHNADEKLSSVSESTLPAEHRLTFIQARDALHQTVTALDNFSEVYNLFAQLIENDKNILVFFQNNNELRATGGFLGTYGSILSSDGLIKSLNINSIYELDGQLQEVIIPPSQLTAVNPRWYLRDSNWFYNFPDSAKKMISFYEKEGGATPDVVMTVTPELIVALLEITGPITMPNYGATLTSENFIETTQLITSIEYDRTLNKPKQMLADFFPLFLQKIGTLSLEERLRTLEIFQRSFIKKQVLLYSSNSELQQKIESFNWGGKVAQTDRDYLAVVHSNLGGTKTDLYVKNNLRIETEIAGDGSIINTVRLTKKNTLSNLESMKNLSFIRFFVPENSELIEASGFTPITLPPVANDNGVTDPEVMALEKGMLLNSVTGTYISKESGKTVFGNWLTLAGGEEKTVTLKYRLPLRLDSVDRYSLTLQKQSGSVFEEVNHRIHFPQRRNVWLMDSKNFRSEPYAVSYTNNLISDSVAGLVLEHE